MSRGELVGLDCKTVVFFCAGPDKVTYQQTDSVRSAHHLLASIPRVLRKETTALQSIADQTFNPPPLVRDRLAKIENKKKSLEAANERQTAYSIWSRYF